MEIHRTLRSLITGACLTLITSNTYSTEIAPPKYNLIDRMGVNMAIGQVQVSQTDVSIGGNMGLSHTISFHSSEYYASFKDNYVGSATSKLFNYSGGIIYPDNFPIVRVTDGTTTADFTYEQTGGVYTYTALNDPRNSLEFVSGTGLVFTQADGTQAIYAISSYNPTDNHSQVGMSSIIYPNGLRVTINRLPSSFALSSVRTNTGFQLKYQYVDDNRPLDPAKQSSTMETDDLADSLAWSRTHPKSIVALNNSSKHCNVADSFCNSTDSWPTATYQWPAGMPRAMAVDQSTLSVTDAEGRKTDYNHTAIDKSILVNGSYLDGVLPDTQSSPRVTSINPPHGNTITYKYANRFLSSTGSSGGLRYPQWFPDGYAMLNSANRGSENIGYTLLVPYGPGSNTLNNSEGYQAVQQIEHNNQKGVMNRIEMADKTIIREDSFYNKIGFIHDKRTDLYHTFEYDGRLNITAIKERDTDPRTSSNPSFEITITKAQYPTSCNSSNRKYCNKATWVEDANARRTNYTYHAASGQIATATLPPDEDGRRAQTRYTYVQKTPTHSGADRSPVWVLNKEEYCRNSANSGSNCSGNDETVTQYQYETENLLMIGKAITASGKTLRTCYRYNRLGQLIGQTEPNANRSSCSY